MIPSNVEKKHILFAVEEIDDVHILSFSMMFQNKIEKYHLMLNDKFYPLRHVVARANWYANGTDGQLGEFRNDKEIKKFVEKLGYSVISEHILQSETKLTRKIRSVDFGWEFSTIKSWREN
jgi:hypothetical protein